ncbi:MAG: transporter [Pseudoxanthomonas sp.]
MNYRNDKQGRSASASTPLAIGLALAAMWQPAAATEGALGRPITGLQITPYAGIIPPEPGMQWSLGYVHYDGEISGGREVPIAGRVSLGLEADVDLYSATGVFVWPTGEGKWNFASMLTVPYIDMDVTANVAVGEATATINDSASNLFDLYFAPVIASYHINQVQHVSMGLYVYAPTADYDPDNLANPGLNVWTLSPTVSYTQLFQKGTLEFSTTGALDWYSKNDDTDYKNGVVARIDALLLKRTASGWGFGAVAGWIQQVEDDSGPTADRLNGFKGRSFGIGPMLSYGKKWPGGEHVDVSFRYISEFSVKNRFEGEPLNLSVSFGF